MACRRGYFARLRGEAEAALMNRGVGRSSALLYEGYALYPYRADALKNRHRWTLGGLVPRAYGERHGEPWSLLVECLVRGDGETRLSVGLRFLRPVGTASSWQEAVEEEFTAPDVPMSESVRWCYRAGPVEAAVEFAAARVGDNLYCVQVQVENVTTVDDPDRMPRDAAMLRSLASANVVLGVRDGKFVSLTDPPEGLKPFADGCRNIGVWPVARRRPGPVRYGPRVADHPGRLPARGPGEPGRLLRRDRD